MIGMRLFHKLNVNMKKIKLTKNKWVLVDDEDFEWLNQWKWHCVREKYAARTIKTKNKKSMLYMHRLIMNPFQNKIVDHINRNSLDNRKKNLRLVTYVQNNANHKLFKTNKSGYHGVYFDKKRKKYRVGISLNNKTKAIGIFSNIKDAAIAYNKVALKYRGQYAQLNQL